MLFTGLAILLVACTMLLSALQGWALAGESRVVRHVLAWVAGSALISLVLATGWTVVAAPRPGAHAPTLHPVATLAINSVIAVSVAIALGAGAMHARQVEGDHVEPAHDVWIGRAVVQGIVLFTVAIGGGAALLFVALMHVR